MKCAWCYCEITLADRYAKRIRNHFAFHSDCYEYVAKTKDTWSTLQCDGLTIDHTKGFPEASTIDLWGLAAPMKKIRIKISKQCYGIRNIEHRMNDAMIYRETHNVVISMAHAYNRILRGIIIRNGRLPIMRSATLK